MTDHIKILRRVGWLLVVVGALDIGVMIYCITNQIAYSSSLNVFAVVAGIFLLRGSLEAVRYVAWFSAFMFSGLLLASLFGRIAETQHTCAASQALRISSGVSG